MGITKIDVVRQEVASWSLVIFRLTLEPVRKVASPSKIILIFEGK
jgi:hypothetical protein